MKTKRYFLSLAVLLLSLSVWGQEIRTETQTLCPGDTITWNGQTITEGGNYVHSIKSKVNPTQDSIIFQLQVTELPAPEIIDEYDTVCSNGLNKYRWHGMKFKQSGTYRYKVPGTCDKVNVLHLTVWEASKDSTITQYFCIADGYNHKGTHYAIEQTIVDSMTNYWGCDSVVTYDYKLLPYYSIPKMFQHHKDSVIHIVFNDSVYTKDGRYYQHYRSKDDCDSVYEITVATQYDYFYSIVKCEGMTVKHGTLVIDSTCTITDSLKTAMGADSLLHFNYSFRRPFYDLDTAYICEGDSFIWTGHMDVDSQVIVLREPGLHRDEHRLAGSDCDSIHELFLIVRDRYIKDSLIIMCNDSLDAIGGEIIWTDHHGRPHRFAKHNLDTMVIDTMPLTTPYPVEGWPGQGGGCDSLFRLRVVITDRCSLDSIPLCTCKGSVEVDGKIYTEPGRYYTKLPSSRGLNLPDSTHTFIIFRVDNDTSSLDTTICESKLPLNYHGKTFASKQSGDYFVKLTNRYGCDSIVQLHIKVIPTIITPVTPENTHKVCPGEPIEVKGNSGKIFTKPGTWTDTVPYTECGCDSVIQIKILYKHAEFRLDTVFLRPGDTYIWEGHKGGLPITQDGMYHDSILNADDCYDVYHLRVIYAEPFYFEETRDVCTKDSFMWHGKCIQEDGVYYDSLKTRYNMDSIYKITVTLHPTYTTLLTHTLCYGDTFYLNDVPYYQSTTVKEDLHTKCCQCDSTVMHNIIVNAATKHEYENLYCAEGKSIIWHEKTLSQTGNYTDTAHYYSRGSEKEKLCDSVIYHLYLEVIHPFHITKDTSVCQNFEPFEWHRQTITQAGTYYDSVATKIVGIYSVWQLNVSTLPTSFRSFNQQICKGGSYSFGTRTLTEPGVYVETFNGANGCDSTVRCILSFAGPDTTYIDTSYVSDSELPIIWRGQTITEPGYYWSTLQKVTPPYCDSILRLHVVHRTSYFTASTVTICDCELPYYWKDGEEGKQWLTEAGTYQAHFVSTQYIDSVIEINLIVNPVDSIVLHTQLCPGGVYDFYGQKITEPGVYRLVQPHVATSCDSTTILYVTRSRTEETIVDTTLCDGQSISIDGQPVSKAGNYLETKRSVDGCDSVIHYIIRNAHFFQTENVTINEGETYIWHLNGQPWSLTEAGTYFDKNQMAGCGCDSTYQLNLTVNKVEYHFHLDTTICACDTPFIWQSHSFSRDTICQVAYQTTMLRDSIYSLNLKVTHLKDSVAYIYECDGNQVTVDGQPYTNATTFTKVYKDHYGCDSIRIKYIINFYPRYILTQTVMLVDGDSVLLGDSVIYTTGEYRHHFLSQYGCDSTVTLLVTACPTVKHSTINKVLCSGDTYILDKDTFTSDLGTTYTKTRMEKTADGCDSVITYNITFISTSNEVKMVAICPGDSYTWRGKTYEDQGTYIDSVPKPGTLCYDTYTLHLVHKPISILDTTISVCEDNLPYYYDGQPYWVDTVFYQQFNDNIYGCDSILRWHYYVNYHCSAYDTYYRCTNEDFKVIDGIVITKAGVYSANHKTDLLEDSLYRFRVLDREPKHDYTSQAAACDSTVYKGQTFLARASETFTVDFKNKDQYGCDSIETRTFTIYTSPRKYIEYATITDYQSYWFENKEYKTPGVHRWVQPDQHGCDSVRELHLTVETTLYPDPEVYYYCKGDPSGIQIWGKTYYPTEYTVVKDTTRINNQPTVRTAEINVQEPFVISKFTAITDQMLCSAPIVAFEVSYDVTTPNLPDRYQVDYQTGDLDIALKRVVQPINGKKTIQIELDGQGLNVPPGYYKFKIRFFSNSCTISDTTIENNLIMVRYPSEIMQSNWDNVVTLLDANANGGHWELQAPYSWQIKDKDGKDKTALVEPNSSTQPYLASNNLRTGDSIWVTLYRADYPQPIPSCPYVFEPVPYNQYQNAVLVYPTVTKKATSIHVEANQQGEYQLYNATGSSCKRGTVGTGDNLIAMPGADGCYLIKITTQDGTEALERVIVY